jgi:hypothetical protein
VKVERIPPRAHPVREALQEVGIAVEVIGEASGVPL